MATGWNLPDATAARKSRNRGGSGRVVDTAVYLDKEGNVIGNTAAQQARLQEQEATRRQKAETQKKQQAAQATQQQRQEEIRQEQAQKETLQQQTARQIYYPNRPVASEETISMRPEFDTSPFYKQPPAGVYPAPEPSAAEKVRRFGERQIDALRQTKPGVASPSDPYGKYTDITPAAIGIAGLSFGRGVADVGLGFVEDISPVSFEGKAKIPLKGTAQAIIRPDKTVKALANTLATDPARGIGQITGIYLTSKVISKAAPEPAPFYEVTRATGPIRILETSEGGQVLIESITSTSKAKTPPRPQSFTAEVAGRTTETQGNVQASARVQDIVKVDPKKGTLQTITRETSQPEVFYSEQTIVQPKVQLTPKKGAITTTTQVDPYTRFFLKDTNVFLSDNPAVGRINTKGGEFQSILITDQPGPGKLYPGLEVVEQKVSGYTRTTTKATTEAEIKLPAQENTLSYREGTIQPKNPRGTKTPSSPSLPGGDRYVFADVAPSGEILYLDVAKPFKPVINVLVKPTSFTYQAAKTSIASLPFGSLITQPKTTEKPTPITEPAIKTEQASQPGILQGDTVVPPRPREILEYPTKTSLVFEEIAGTTRKPRIDTKPATDTTTKTGTTPIIQPVEIIEEDTAQQQRPDQIISTTPTTAQQQRLFPTTPRPTPPRAIFTPPRPILEDNNIDLSTGFSVFIRRQGKFTKSPGTYTQEDALNYGAYKVGNTAAASFFIQQSDQPASNTFTKKGKLTDFIKKGGIFIEKPSRRIKSSGELREITFKGIASQNSKKSAGRLRKLLGV